VKGKSMSWVAGVDGCKAGWFVILKCLETQSQDCRLVSSAAELLELRPEPTIIAVDIPIGLLATSDPGGRQCDIEARTLLGWPRRNSVFSPPVRAALSAHTYDEAASIHRCSVHRGCGISKQCFGIFPKLREIDALMTPEIQSRIKEVHPELCFYALNGNRPLLAGKKSAAGRKVRRELLDTEEYGRIIGDAAQRFKRSQVALDDIHDACVACWSACRIQAGTATRIPHVPPADGGGLVMEMWF
jgi:predicted RNase H-like nuclease